MAKPKIALVGGETLLGKEIEDVLKSRVKAHVSTYSATGEGNFGESEGEAVYVEPFEASSIQDARAVIFAGTAEGAQKVYEVVTGLPGKPLLIDCTGLLENRPEARIIAPLLADTDVPDTGLLELAHPAAAALALVLSRLNNASPVRQAIVHVFEPASEQGRRGVSELHQQTTSLLSFKPLDKQVFDAQLSFNLLAQYGEEGIAKLARTEQRIERHVASLIAQSVAKTPLPSLRVIGAPVFHGYSLSVWAEFKKTAETEQLAEALASAQIEVRGSNDDAPSGADVAGQSGLIAGDIRIDHNNPRAAWFWIVGDNLRLTADAAADLVMKLEVPAR
ncbi:MAG TPA: Asd/ArgC dimerization domain-containing protein [Bryobacteraceae bacterium]|nr:Asd/ArgC dimerization domain-containing protein [Bryobacteraceae bacterium]